MEVHLVADTNLFFECKALDQLPWAELGYDPVIILLTKPVLDEIDKHKNASGRTRDRAVDIFSLVRGMLTSGVKEVEIQAASPNVILRLMTNVTPAPAFRGQLDYNKNDERLVGITSTLHAQASGYAVILFTDDAGAASTADGCGVPFLLIDSGWRRPPAQTSQEKRIKNLEKDLATFRAQEPQIHIKRCEPADDSDCVEVAYKVATPLTEPEISTYLDMLRQKHPLQTDFTPPDEFVATDDIGVTTTTTYTAPSDDQIARYRDTQYPEWIERCRSVLADLHLGRDEDPPPVILLWSMSNSGTRPASKVRVEFEAKGPLEIRRLKPKSDEDEDGDSDTDPFDVKTPSRVNLPSPPQPPAFHTHVSRVGPSRTLASNTPPMSTLMAGRKTPGFLDTERTLTKALAQLKHPLHEHLTALDAIKAASGISDKLMARDVFKEHATLVDSGRLFSPAIPKRHDPEAFYYDWPATLPVKKGALYCDLWRHQTDDEVFEFEVLFTKDGEVQGIVECTIHAENLTKPAQAVVKIAKTIQPLSMHDLAKAIVEAS